MPGLNIKRHDFEHAEELVVDLAYAVAEKLRAAISARGSAVIAVSGGSTPVHFFEELSNEQLDWPKVTITLVDERCVDETSPRSNTALVRGKLLQNAAAEARLLPIYRPDLGANASGREAGREIEQLGLPLDVVILGMGSDGHTASFFPDAQELASLLDPDGSDFITTVHADSAGELRLTMTMPLLARARFIALHIEGSEKLATLEKALAPGSTLPIRRVIDAARTPVEIFWAP